MRHRRPTALWLVVGCFILAGAGCRPSPVAQANVPTLAATAAVAHSPTADTATAAPTHSATPIPTRPAELPAAPPSPTPVAVGETLSRTPRATTQATSTPTETAAPPTFTPPPPPPPPDGEHLVLRRPVPDGGTTWTDKSYPYGGTRGGALRPHNGVEFSVSSGTPVLAVAPGTVVVAGDDSAAAYGPEPNFYGNLVIIEVIAGDVPIYALYGHLSEVSVAVGQMVAPGEVLGLSGDSGIADGPHLHFEVRAGENSYMTTRNPLLWLTPQRQMGVVAGRVTGPGGALLHEAPITLERIDAPSPYTATASYAAGGPNADGTLGENFAVDDVFPGYYQVIAGSGRQRATTELWVFPDRVNWIELTIDAP